MKPRVWLVLLVVLSVCIGGASAAPIPSQGLPDVTIDVAPGEDQYSLVLSARATDPDGRIRRLALCPGNGEGCAVEQYPTDQSRAAAVRTCVVGDARSLVLDVRYPGAGSYTVVARAVGDGCAPLTGRGDTRVELQIDIVDPPPSPPPIHVDCADSGSPRATAPGVTEDTVWLGLVATLSGPRADGSAVKAVRSAVDDVNETGGICGRSVELTLVDDGGDPQRSSQYTRAFLSSGDVFGLVAMPSRAWQGTIAAGDIDASGVPIVGTLGSVPTEFDSGWVWPVGSAPRVFASITVRHAYDEGARRFAIVRDSTDGWATAAAQEITTIVAGLEGAEVVVDEPILPARASYSTEIQHFNESCSGSCDAIIEMLSPHTALTWEAGKPEAATIERSVWPDLLHEAFASNCGMSCQGVLSWADFHPPIGSTSVAVDRYRAAVAPDGVDRDAEGAYVGAVLMLEAIGRAGTELTRERLRTILDGGSFDGGLTGGPLSWSVTRAANRWERAYSIVVVRGSFAGWRQETDWIEGF